MRICKVQLAVSAIALFGLFGWAAAQPAQPALSADEIALKKTGIAIDDAALLQYFSLRTPTEEQKTILKQRAVQLGSSVYSLRIRASDELIRAGRASLPYLRDLLKSRDTETVRRAQYCILVIEQHSRQATSAMVCRVLVERKVSGAAEALLAYMPIIEDRWVEEEFRHGLARIVDVKGRLPAALESALKDASPKRRAIAAAIVGASNDPEQRRKVVALLTDPSAEVRLDAAGALLTSNRAEAVPTLIDLLSASPSDIAFRAEDLLWKLAEPTGPAVWLDSGKDDNAGKVRTAWQSWWETHANKLDAKSLLLGDASLGLTLVIENQRPDGNGRIYEIDKAGQVRWQIAAQNPLDAQWLPGGRLLVCDARSSQVCEMDTRGIVGWKYPHLAATSCQRLPTGNTVVSTYQHIHEITRDGRIVFSHATKGHTYCARKLPAGHYLWLDHCGELTEIDGDGKTVAMVDLGRDIAWGSIQLLKNGRYLVALGGIGKVQEIDMKGKIYWQKEVNNPNRAVRLPNGHTLVASHGDHCIYEFDARGERQWQHVCLGRPFAVARR